MFLVKVVLGFVDIFVSRTNTFNKKVFREIERGLQFFLQKLIEASACSLAASEAENSRLVTTVPKWLKAFKQYLIVAYNNR